MTAPGELPPASNRGAEIRAGLGALCFTVHADNMRDRADDINSVRNSLLGWVQGDFYDLEHGWRAYRHQAKGPAGSRVCWGDEHETIHVELKEQWLAAIGQGAELAQFVEWVNEVAFYGRPDGRCEVRVTRVDSHLDDYEKRVRPGDVEAWVDTGRAVSHAQKQEFNRSRRQRGAERGESFYFGRSGSRRRLCVYDKAVESKGEIDAIRWELREREEAAQAAFDRLLQWVRVYGSLEGYGKVVAERLVSFVDFRGEDGERLVEYEELVQGAVRGKGYELPKPVVEIAKVVEQLRKQWGPTLAGIFKATGGDLDFLIRLLKDGKRRMRARHLALAAQPFDWRSMFGPDE